MTELPPDEPDGGPDPGSDGEPDLPEQRRVRREKLDRLLAAGVDAFPVHVPRTHTLAEIRAAYPDLAPDEHTGDGVGVTGRVIFMRNTGKLCFATLREGDGTELQAMLSRDRVGTEALAAWKADVDLGDLVFIEGEVVASRRGELSVLATRWTFVAKALRPLPVAHRAMTEESRVRQRYLDLIVRPEARRMVEMRAAVTASLRESLRRRGFLEVETPMLEAVRGGATARPFVTHFNAFDLDVYLRIALELPLKRCVAGGIERVFEIAPVLRNEGADSTHSPEFAIVEVYEAYGDYNSMAVLTRELWQEAARTVSGSTTVTRLDGSELDLGGQWRTESLYRLVSGAVGEQITPQTPTEELRALAAVRQIPLRPEWPPGRVVEELFEEACAGQLTGPVFVRDFPLDMCPLTRPHRSTPGVAEKWDLYIDGVERATAYSELVDPLLQRQNLLDQLTAAAAGDVDAMELDEDFLRAMEYGMPPMGGMGMGVDRLMQAFTGRGLRETILFPFVRPE
ncbi:MAG: lysine--tRNA ligase [Mycobacteriales bacterium]|nr:MAG: lysine--tRNA ligase [Pseudonocardiales bacterium]